jgi:hypothetical protein
MTRFERLLLTRKVRGHKAEFMRRLPRLKIEDIIEGAKIGDRTTLRTVIFLRRIAEKEFYVDELDREDLVRAVAADLFFQFPCAPWRRTMYYFCPSVALGNDFMAEEEETHRRIHDILSGAFAKTKIVRLNAPMNASSSDLVLQIDKFAS